MVLGSGFEFKRQGQAPAAAPQQGQSLIRHNGAWSQALLGVDDKIWKIVMGLPCIVLVGGEHNLQAPTMPRPQVSTSKGPVLSWPVRYARKGTAKITRFSAHTCRASRCAHPSKI